MLTACARLLIVGLLACACSGCATRVAETPVFCYRWLTDITCYDEPVPDAEARLTGGYYTDPGDPSTRSYWLERARMSR